MGTENVILQIDELYLAHVQPDFIKKALHLTLQRFTKTHPPAINVVITGSETVRQLNHQYRGINSPTDVLSFANTPDPDFPDFDQDYLGDIVIAYPVAEIQAKAGGHTPMEELALLAVHGTLHLLGFDHDSPAKKKNMWTTQQEIMAELGLEHIQPTEN